MAGNDLAVASTLRELILYGLSNADRRLFPDLTIQAFLPDGFDASTPAGVLADWYEDRGDTLIVEVLRSLDFGRTPA